MKKSNVRCKRDYEDLDNGSYSSSEHVRNPASPIDSEISRPKFFLSDTSLDRKSKSIQVENATEVKCVSSIKSTGSIPCFLLHNRLHGSLPSCNEENMKSSENSTSTSSRRHNLWQSGYILFYVCFLVAGSFCMQAIETPGDRELRDLFIASQRGFQLKYPQVADADLQSLIEVIMKTRDSGISIQNITEETSWNFGNSLFFTSTLVTTIGYGNISPKSSTGKIFCILYAVVGIPLTLILLNIMVERLLTPVNFLLKILSEKLNRFLQPFHIRLLHFSIITILIAFLFLILPAIVFTQLEEEWSFLDAVYFGFLSLTTVGLGDYIPGTSTNHQLLYKMLTSIYLIVGLGFVMMLLTVYCDIPQLNLGLWLSSGEKRSPDAETEEKIDDKQISSINSIQCEK